MTKVQKDILISVNSSFKVPSSQFQSVHLHAQNIYAHILYKRHKRKSKKEIKKTCKELKKRYNGDVIKNYNVFIIKIFKMFEKISNLIAKIKTLDEVAKMELTIQKNEKLTQGDKELLLCQLVAQVQYLKNKII